MGGDIFLITGGAGLIGSHIAELLLSTDLFPNVSKVRILDNFSRGVEKNLNSIIDDFRIEIIEGDIRDQSCVDKAMKGVDYLFHQAAIRITQCAKEPRLANEVLVDGTFNVAEAANHNEVKKIVLASSASVYGMADLFPTEESHHTYNNRTLYGAAKVYAEQLLRSFNEMYGLNYLVLRYFNVYGPRMDTEGVYTEVFIRWMERISKGLPPIIFGDGEQTMDFVYATDIARANILAMASSASDQIFNIASGDETSLNMLARYMCSLMDSDLSPRYQGARNVNSVVRRLAETERTEEKLGFKSEIGIEEGLQNLITWWREKKGISEINHLEIDVDELEFENLRGAD